MDSSVWIVNEENTYSIKDELKASGAIYDSFIKWYFPNKLPSIRFNLIEIKVSDYFNGMKSPRAGFASRFKRLMRKHSLVELDFEISDCVDSVHYGSIGDKTEKVLQYRNSRAFDNDYYGTSYFHFFTDDLDNVFLWKSGTYPDWISDDFNDNLKFTIKEHSEYDEVKQTVILRVRKPKKK